MNWRRAATRYGQTPAPATPYQRAEQLWDERIGSARVQAANWRLMAFGALALAAVAMGDDIRAALPLDRDAIRRRGGSHRCGECDRAGGYRIPAERRPDRLFPGAFRSEYPRAFGRPHCRAAGVARRLRPDHEPCQARARRLRAAGRPLCQGRTSRCHGRSHERGARLGQACALPGSSMRTRKVPQYRRSVGRRS